MPDMIRHLNCATMRPAGSFGGRMLPPRMIAHVLLVERADGLLLVDSGFGLGDIADPGRLGKPFTSVVRPALDTGECAITQVKAWGYDAADVTDIALTHLDLDHAGGIPDFPGARIHVFGAELDAALNPTMREKARYIQGQWAHGPNWVRHEDAGDDWFGFAGVTALGDDVLLIPLHGHTRGHCGIAVRDGDAWLLHAGDAYFSAGEVQTPPSCPPGLKAFQSMMGVDNTTRLANQQRLRELVATHGSQVRVFSAHDASEYDALAS